MARRGEPVYVVRSTLTDLMDVRTAPLLLAFNLEPGEATLVSLTTVDRADAAGGGGSRSGGPSDHRRAARPHYKFRPAGDLCDFLTRFSEAGCSHHQALA